MSSNIVIADTAPLSYFLHGGVFSLLQALLAGRLMISRTGHTEVASFPPLAHEVKRAVEHGWLQVCEPAPAELALAAQFLAAGLDPGESEALAVAQTRRWILACDERAARRLAEAQRSGHLSPAEADAALNRMRQASQRLPPYTYEEFRRLIESTP